MFLRNSSLKQHQFLGEFSLSPVFYTAIGLLHIYFNKKSEILVFRHLALVVDRAGLIDK